MGQMKVLLVKAEMIRLHHGWIRGSMIGSHGLNANHPRSKSRVVCKPDLACGRGTPHGVDSHYTAM